MRGGMGERKKREGGERVKEKKRKIREREREYDVGTLMCASECDRTSGGEEAEQRCGTFHPRVEPP